MHTPVPSHITATAISIVACAALMLVGLKFVQSPLYADMANQFAATGGASWRSVLYPANWKPANPDKQGRFLHDFSYAGYHYGEDPIPENPPGDTYDVTAAPYSTDKTGKTDATAAIQQAINDAGAAGGGIVFLPKGTYKVSLQNNSDIAALYIPYSGVVLRGAGPGQTFIYNNTVQMRGKSVIYIGAQKRASLGLGDASTEVLLTSNVALPTTKLQVTDVSKYEVGDWIVVGTDLTAALIKNLGMTGKWKPNSFQWIRLPRRVTEVDPQTNTLTIDIPTRYSMLMRDKARVRKIVAPPQEIGVERLAIANRRHPGKGWSDQDGSKPGTGAYQVHQAALIRAGYTAHSWIRNVSSYAPQGNGNFHMLSRGVELLEGAHSVTVQNVTMSSAQYRGPANGLGFHVRGGENLLRNCEASNMRHNLELWGASATGNVFYDCTARDGELPSEFHGHFSAINLFDNTMLGGGEELVAENRTGKGSATGTHGLTTTQSVFWNTKGNGEIDAGQFKWGYVIGTQNGVGIDMVGSLPPADFVEGKGKGSTLVPQSLYLDQLKRRLSSATSAAPAPEVEAATLEQALVEEPPVENSPTPDEDAGVTEDEALVETSVDEI